MENKIKNKSKKEEQVPQKKMKKIEQELRGCQEKRDEYLAGWQRAQADFSNYKKEETNRLKDMTEYVNLNLILKILPILDSFDLAEKNLSKEIKDDKNVIGVLRIKTQILDFLKNQEIEEIKTTKEKFDPNFHEAIAEAEDKDKESGMVIEELQKGYKLDGKVIRPARVKVVK